MTKNIGYSKQISKRMYNITRQKNNNKRKTRWISLFYYIKY